MTPRYLLAVLSLAFVSACVSKTDKAPAPPPPAPPIPLPQGATLWTNARVVIAWEFDKDGDSQGWNHNEQLKDVKVAEGFHHSRAIGQDPILSGPLFEIPASPWQWIEVRARCDRAGQVQIFWTETTEGKYEGFSENKLLTFSVKGNNEWNTYRLLPFWHRFGKIVRIRFDSFSDAKMDVDYIRVMEGAPAVPPSPVAEWDFSAPGAFPGWFADPQSRNLRLENGAMKMDSSASGATALCATGGVDVAGKFFVNVRMKAGRCEHANIIWASDEATGLAERAFKLVNDGRWHWYNLDMSSASEWTGKVLAIGLDLPQIGGPGGAEISRLAISSDPVGEPEIEVSYFGPGDAVSRAGRRTELLLVLNNRSGMTAGDIRADLELPEGWRMAEGEPALKVPELEFSERIGATWKVVGDRPGVGEFKLRLKGTGVPDGVFTARLELTPAPEVAGCDYIPPPVPAKSKYEVGAFYFPGWPTANKWSPILDVAPERKPVLGWYDEANPECADWQIKWSVENGIKFYLVDWYWHKGGRHLEHWLHDAYGKARYRSYLKFALMWANHNPPDSHSAEDWRAVTQYWIDHYFSMPEYYCIDGKPAVFIWAPGNIRRDAGGTEQAKKLYDMSQEMARAAGLKGIYFAAMSAHEDKAACELLKTEGYEGFTEYHTFPAAISQAENPKRFPYQLVVDAAPKFWEDKRSRSDMLYFPLADTGWASEPWHGYSALTIFGRTPELFKDLCLKSRAYLDKHDKKIVILGPTNEWGEGSYIEPCAEYGFKMFDAVREAFCEPGPPPQNLIPSDVGRGPYDLPMVPALKETSWRFDKDGDSRGWNPMMGLSDFAVKDGRLRAVCANGDPALSSPILRLNARKLPYLIIRMRTEPCDAGSDVQVFWSTSFAGSTSEANSAKLSLDRNGKMRDYAFDLASNPRWRGLIRGLRLDTGSTSGAVVEIEEIRFADKP
ncbi:MAG TPA: glycoside hydrolase family 99-like domain-containing protein [Candidatus Brocadiia bacterium]|nr:glycoside hydrolase family 99-like domain-containing protein [Candidatus Brocadiia bacterium]